MKVFISWSGEPSRSVGIALSAWLESTIQHVDTWLSDTDIQGGRLWSHELVDALGEANFGIICLTRANLAAPWVIFEAGALAKRLSVARVVPLYIGLAPSDVTGPLSTFQGRAADKSGLMRLAQDVNGACEKTMSRTRLNDIFEAMWPRLCSQIESALKNVGTQEHPQRTQEDMLAELVNRVRYIEATLGELTKAPHGVHVLFNDGDAFVRDRRGRVLRISVAAWNEFIEGVKRGDFDALCDNSM
jgi:hypothetical protein